MRDDKVLGSTVRIDCTTHDSTGALVAPSSALAASDFRIYKDGSATEKATTNGITVTSPFDSIVGKHLIEIDTSNSTGDSGFWAAGSEYRVEINSAKTISSIVQSGVVVGRFALVAAGVLRPTVDGRTLNVSTDHDGAAVLNSGALDPVLEAVADVQASIDAGGSPVFTAVVVARIATGAAAGWPESLTIGDAYLSENAGAQPLFIKDVADNILSGLGTKNFADADFVATLRLAPLTDGTRTLDTPPTTIEVKSTDVVGILYNDDTDGAEYFELQIPRAKTLLGVTKTKYSCQFIMNWGEDNTFERTVNLGEIKFLRKNAPGA